MQPRRPLLDHALALTVQPAARKFDAKGLDGQESDSEASDFEPKEDGQQKALDHPLGSPRGPRERNLGIRQCNRISSVSIWDSETCNGQRRKRKFLTAAASCQTACTDHGARPRDQARSLRLRIRVIHSAARWSLQGSSRLVWNSLNA